VATRFLPTGSSRQPALNQLSRLRYRGQIDLFDKRRASSAVSNRAVGHPITDLAAHLGAGGRPMNSAVLIGSILKPVLWLLPLLIFVAFLKSPAFKGWFGERVVSRRASFSLPPGEYIGYDNVTIPDGAGTTQIDHIYVSRFGVFVVETKNMGGWIFGQADQAQWTQAIYKKKSKFQNPIRQNFKHIKTLEDLLQLSWSKLHPVIVFTGDSTFKTELPRCVCTLSNFTDYIESFRAAVLSDREVSEICSKIENHRLVPNSSTQRTHVQYLRNKHRH
jgi:restriction system protein